MASFDSTRSVSGSTIAALGVVEHLDVVEDVGSGVIAGRVDLAANAFALEQLERVLGRGVVVAAAATAHAGDQVVIAQEVLPVMTGELTALVRMRRDRLFGLTSAALT